ncbi:hypothetical protein [Leptotrichia alba]|uniref:Uncharacterized protein n=1 Tax=Leptotrichia alba TaxID=3239304 RepID=A0AB39V0R4_9FUSO
MYLKKADYSKKFEKETTDYKNIFKIKLIKDEKDMKIHRVLKFLEKND